jgi:delta 1-pyrroline-5-carboxylate dehydrogenase
LEGIYESLDKVESSISPPSRDRALPRKIWSTHPNGSEGVDEYFELWTRLLPRPLSSELQAHFAYAPKVVQQQTEGGDWTLDVADDNDIDGYVSAWTGEEVVRDQEGKSRWTEMWGKLPFGVLRADIYR